MADRKAQTFSISVPELSEEMMIAAQNMWKSNTNLTSTVIPSEPKITTVGDSTETSKSAENLPLLKKAIRGEQTLGELHRARASIKVETQGHNGKGKMLQGESSTGRRTNMDHYSQGEDFATQVAALARIAGTNNAAKQCTIYPIPDEIRSCDPESYEPRAVIIGPHFYAKRSMENLNQLQDYKWSCVNKLLVRSDCPEQQEGSNLMIKKLLDKIKELEPKIRNSYMMKFDLKSEELALIMMLDGCLILHLLLKPALQKPAVEETRTAEATPTPTPTDEDWTQVLGRCWIWNLVRYDLLLLENQIPFLVIKTIFDCIKCEHESYDILVTGTLNLFSTLHPCKKDTTFPIAIEQVHHLLHLVYLSILPSNNASQSNDNNDLPPSELPNWVPSAKELNDAGIKFKKRKTFNCFLDIKFSNGTLEIPNLQVYDYSKILFRNFIAFEQCYPDTRAHVTAYASFMDCLLNTPEDMRLLHLSGVIVNRMTTDQDAVNFFSHLCNQVHYASKQNYLLQTIINVNKYHGSKWHKWRAGLVRKYFSNPWVIISLFLAGFLLFLTMTQTFFAAYAYFKPPKSPT